MTFDIRIPKRKLQRGTATGIWTVDDERERSAPLAVDPSKLLTGTGSKQPRTLSGNYVSASGYKRTRMRYE